MSAAPDRREKENEAKDRPESTWLISARALVRTRGSCAEARADSLPLPASVQRMFLLQILRLRSRPFGHAVQCSGVSRS